VSTLKTLKALLMLAAVFLVSPSSLVYPAGDSASEALDKANFRIAAAPNYKGARWIYAVGTGKIIGYARWDTMNRRYTLFDLHGHYYGYFQATLGNTKNEYYTQYLWYGKDNRYKKVLITGIGGRPVTRDNPYGELGGGLLPHERGNIPVPPTSFKAYESPLERFGIKQRE